MLWPPLNFNSERDTLGLMPHRALRGTASSSLMVFVLDRNRYTE